jgi:hypothetical protein
MTRSPGVLPLCGLARLLHSGLWLTVSVNHRGLGTGCHHGSVPIGFRRVDF